MSERINLPSTLFLFAANDDDTGAGEGDGEDTIVVPEDLTVDLSDDDLTALEGSLIEAFDALYDADPADVEHANTLAELAENVKRVRDEQRRRGDVREKAAAEAEALRAQIHGADDSSDGDSDEDGDDDGGDDAGDAPATPDADSDAAADAPADSRETVAASSRVSTQGKGPARINVSLARVKARAPEAQPEPTLAITAAADVPGFQSGHRFDDLSDLARAFQERARSTPVSTSGNRSGPKVATIRHEFEHVISRQTPDTEIREMIKAMTSQDRLEASLTAGGGWCAPSSIVYDFFNITCEDGMIDLPTFGVDRGGIRWPVSPSFADVFSGEFTNETNPWLWTESDDINVVTGGPSKPCVRVTCPDFDEARLECYGICIIAGNLTDSAYPEATENTIALTQSAHYHVVNARYIATMAALSTVVPTGAFVSNTGGAAADLLSSTAWAAVNYRIRYGMCSDDILEVVLPAWTLETIRADLSRRTGVNLLDVTDAQIAAFFDIRRIRVQFVQDWQVRGDGTPGGSTPTQEEPDTVQFMIYAAGTWGLGNGMTLDLGVVRDSTLNADNDHTAAWSEECHLLARFGHESLIYTVGLCVQGRTGAANLTCEGDE